MYCRGEHCAQIVVQQHLCDACLQQKWGTEPCFLLPMFPSVLVDILLAFLGGEYARWIQDGCKMGDLGILRALLNGTCNKKKLCATLKQHCVLAYSLKNANTSIASYLIDRFVSSDTCDQHQLSELDPFLLALFANKLEIAYQLQHNVVGRQECAMLLTHFVDAHELETEWVQCALSNFPTFVDFVRPHKQTLCDAVVRLKSQYLFDFFCDDMPQLMLYSLTQYDCMLWFEQVWFKMFSHTKAFDPPNETLVRVLKLAISHESFSVLDFLIDLPEFQIPRSLKLLCAKACKTQVSFVQWIERSTKPIFNFLLRLLAWDLDNPLCNRVFFDLLNNCANNEERMSFLLNVTSAAQSVFCVLAIQGRWNIFFNLLSRYNLPCIGSAEDCCAIVKICFKTKDMYHAQRLFDMNLLVPCEHKPTCLWQRYMQRRVPATCAVTNTQKHQN